MWGFVRGSDALKTMMLAFAIGLASPALAEAPTRVVSMNLCTDQLALMLAAPGQLVSVSFLAHDGAVAALSDAARALPANRGLAEEIYLLQPDLVLAGPYSTGATVAMLARLGVPVARFALENSLDDVETSLTRMGAVLGREAQAAAAIAQFRTDRTALAARAALREPQRAALYSARGWTGGTVSLASDILRAAGLQNIAAELGLDWGGQIALEALIMANPDRLVLGEQTRGYSEAQALLDHPALRSMRAYGAGVTTSGPDWVCGTPFVLRAVARLLDQEGS